MKTTSLKVYPRDLEVLRARCRPGQTPAGALAELLASAPPAIDSVRSAWGDPTIYTVPVRSPSGAVDWAVYRSGADTDDVLCPDGRWDDMPPVVLTAPTERAVLAAALALAHKIEAEAARLAPISG